MSLQNPVVATLKAGGGTPEVEIVVGHLHKAKYQLLLFDETGANPVGIGQPDGKGKTGDGIPDKFALPGAIAALHRKSVFWQVAMAALSEVDANAPFVATVRVMQDGAIVGLDGGNGSLAAGQFHLKVES